jgi:tryptophan synthase alpha chain
MSRITETFESAGRPLFIAFTVAGDPDMERSLVAADALVASGADILELGVPFSDPVADGPVIQRADIRALDSGTSPDTVFEIVRHIRHSSSIPIVLLTYYNSVFHRGIGKFFRDAADSGVDGILIADMPVEESDEVADVAGCVGIDLIFMVSENTSPERLEKIISRAGGFLYLVSHFGVTGILKDLPTGIEDFIRKVREKTSMPIAVGFGISSPDHAVALYSAGADAAIAGSAIVRFVEEYRDDPVELRDALITYAASMRRATMSAKNV